MGSSGAQNLDRPTGTLAEELAASNRTNARIEELLGRLVRIRAAESAGLVAPEAAAAVARSFHAHRSAAGLRCPQCNKRALRKARRKTFFETLAVALLFVPYRCRYCRYYEMRSMLEGAGSSQPASAGRTRRRR